MMKEEERVALRVKESEKEVCMCCVGILAWIDITFPVSLKIREFEK
jgi:hypothetical protein